MITWIILRAAGVGAYLMLFASVAWGLVGTTSVVGKRVAKPSAIAIHQFIATVAMVLLGVHIGGLLIDAFVPFGILDMLVPMHGTFKPVAVTFGVAAMYAMVVVLVSSWLRKPLGTKWWRRLHLLAVPAFGLSMVHGAFAGTDTVRPWMWWVYVGTGGMILFLVLTRGLTGGIRAVRAAHPGPRAALPTSTAVDAPAEPVMAAASHVLQRPWSKAARPMSKEQAAPLR